MFTLQLSNRSRGDNVNVPFKMEADNLHSLTIYVMTKYLRREGDTCIITTSGIFKKIIVIEKDSSFVSRFHSGYRIQNVTNK